MTVIDLPRFRPRQNARPTAAATNTTRRQPITNRSLLMLVLFLQGATLGVVIGGGLFTAVMLSDLTASPARITPPVMPTPRQMPGLRLQEVVR